MSINEMNMDEVRKEYLDFLKERLEYHCNKDMCCEIYWDYRDELSPDTLKEAVDGYKEAGYENPKNYLSEKLWELNMDYDSYMFDEIEKEIRNCDNVNVVEYFVNYGDLHEDAAEIGYNGIDVCVDEILGKSEFRLNILFGTDNERNFDMSSIVSSFGSWRDPDFEYLESDLDILDNAFTYLIHQQGHSVKEVYDCLFGNKKGFGSSEEMDFIKSVVNEIVNNPSEALSELCALVKLDGNQYLELLDAVDKGEQFLTFKKDTMIGLFNDWSGGGSLLEVELDKPFVVPVSMVRNVQVEGSRDKYGYTVDEVYGLIGSCWKDNLGYTDEKPVLFEEDLKLIVDSFKVLELKDCLSVRLVDFYKDYDHYNFRDSLQPGETEEDVIARMKEGLESQDAIDSLLEHLNDISSDEDLSVKQRREVSFLIKNLSDLKSSSDKQDIKPGLDDVIQSCERLSKNTSVGNRECRGDCRGDER